MEQQNVLERILQGRMKPTHLSLETLRKITDEFSVDRIIGEGGFGTVYKGVIGNENVAVKRIKSRMTVYQKLFRREVDSQLDVNHENVVRFLGLCSHTVETPIKDPVSRGYIYAEIRERLLCFEYVGNGSLDKYITDELRGLEWDTRYQIIRGICTGLQYLHMEKRILHLDLKPANILLDNQMVPKITDFSLSRPVDNPQTMTTSHFSSLGYGAPENLFGNGSMSLKSDMYSLGAIIIELITGRKGIPDDQNNILRRWRHRWNKSVKETPLEYHQQVTECIEIGLLCLNIDAYARPSITEVMSKFVDMESTKVNPFYWEDDMLGVEPLELQFVYSKKKQIFFCSVELSNDTDGFIAFKIQTNSPLPYSVEPNKDIVKPRSNCSVDITLVAANTQDHEDSTSNKQYTKVFIVQSIKVNEGLTPKDINQDMFGMHKAGHNVDEIDLAVVFSSEENMAEEVMDCPSKQGNKQYASSDDSSLQSGMAHVNVNVNDEDPIIAASNSGTRPTPIEPGSVQLVINSSKKAPFLEYNTKVMLEFTGGDYTCDRPGLDLVVVLDFSASGLVVEKMAELKTAMRFIMQKLSPIDHLSAIIFSRYGNKFRSLQQITGATQRELLELIGGLKAFDKTSNMEDGLLTGLQVLANRKVKRGRVAAIMLMSDDQQSEGKASEVSVGNVPVYTFGFGTDSNNMVLSTIAANSTGGTFSHIQDIGSGGLTMAFSQCLAGLLTVSVQDFELMVASVRDDSSIVKVTAGTYLQTQEKGANGLDSSVTVTFGSLYSREVRRVIVDLLLPATESQHSTDILNVTYSYRSRSSGSWQQFVAPPETVTVWRTASLDLEETLVELQREETRLQMARLIEEARNVSRYRNQQRTDKLVEAQNMLVQQSNFDPLLRTELQELWKLQARQLHFPSQWNGLYYALSLALSHGRQRFAARGDIQIMRLFATPRMDMYLEQAKKFLDDPAMKLLSSLDDDNIEEEVFVASREEEMRRLSLEMEN